MRGSRDAFAFSPEKPASRGVLVLHGFSGSPFEVRYLGEKLAARGLEVLGPALAGHEDGLPARLDGTTWRDWLASAEAGLDQLRRTCRDVAVVGLSMGGLLSLHLAANRGSELRAIVPMAVPLWLQPWQMSSIRAVNRSVARVSTLPLVGRVAKRTLALRKQDGVSDIADRAARRENPSMPAMPLRALGSLLELMDTVRGELPAVRVPALCVHAVADHTAPYACLNEIVTRIGSSDVRAMTLHQSFHVLPIDRDRDRLALAVGDFLEEKLR